MVTSTCHKTKTFTDSFCVHLSGCLAIRGVTVRRASAMDEPFLKMLYADVRKDEVGAWGWGQQAVAQFLEMQFQAQHSAYNANYPGADHLILLERDKSIGRVMVKEFEEEFRLIDIALLGDYRGNGIGRLIVEGLVTTAAEVGKAAALSVHHGNPAAALYSRCGFEVAGGDEVYLQMHWSPDRL